MEVDRIQCKFPRISNGGDELGAEEDEKMEEEDGIGVGGGGERKEVVNFTGGGGGGVDIRGAVGRFYGWPSSRIVRVSRASGGKDRHSKVLTSKGLRDRRVRLSVNTAIQFYDLQDRLGFDQPSKAVEWLLKAAASSIAELPPMKSPFPDGKRSDSAEPEMEMDPNYSNLLPAAAKSSGGGGCSSNSENSKNSISRSGRKRAAAEEEKMMESSSSPAENSLLNNNPTSQATSFTELLNGGLVHKTPNSNFFLKSDIFSGIPFSRSEQLQQYVNVVRPMFSVAGENESEIHFSAGGGNTGDNDSNHHHQHQHGFTISTSSGLPGFDRGTLQSNTPLPPPPSTSSSSLLPTPASFFPLENQFLSGLHLYSQKGKGKK